MSEPEWVHPAPDIKLFSKDGREEVEPDLRPRLRDKGGGWRGTSLAAMSGRTWARIQLLGEDGGEFVPLSEARSLRDRLSGTIAETSLGRFRVTTIHLEDKQEDQVTRGEVCKVWLYCEGLSESELSEQPSSN
jgi:hypothetical protein